LHAESGIDGCLIGIGGGTGEIVEVEASEELVLRGDFVVKAQRELVGVGDDL